MKQTNVTHNIRVDKNKSNRAVYEVLCGKTGQLLVILLRNMCLSMILVWPW